ncbi:MULTISPECIES: hypothetical protein [unclassified Psychrobacillus]|uniref:hypothetical protein n=1 Tax=unclassified Psychrobacillus TaxID=2636677 RepID=UPI0030F9A69E
MNNKNRFGKIIVAFLMSIGLFTNVSSGKDTNLEKQSTTEYVQNSDETIDGKH